MNRPDAISRHRTALLAIVAAIAALIGERKDGVVARGLRNAALALLRPAESAARRLIVLAAQGLSAAPQPAPAFPGAVARGGGSDGLSSRPPVFRLFDPPKRHAPWLAAPPPPAGVPRIRSFWGPAAPLVPCPQPAAAAKGAKPLPDPDAPVDAARLHLRLAALDRALSDLPRQARRLARWRSRNVRPSFGPRPQSPLRLGHPPGHRGRRSHPVDDVLKDCHRLAVEALARDTS